MPSVDRCNVSGGEVAETEGRTHLEVGLDDVEDEIPVRSAQLLHDRRKVEEELGDERVDLLIEVVVTADPRLHPLNEEHGPLLREEDDGRIERRCCREEESKEVKALSARCQRGDSCESTSELVLVSLETRALAEDALDGENDRAGEVGACGRRSIRTAFAGRGTSN